MNRLFESAKRTALGWVVLPWLVALAACGGDGTIGSIPGMAVGTVNGFGSVIVDGVPYGDLAARVVTETAPGVAAAAEVLLGDRVSVTFSEAGVASVVTIDTALSGPVATAVSSGSFTMLGQTVMIGGQGPTTQFGGGYRRAADIVAGDPVDVQGFLVQQGGSYVIAATRIDKLSAAPAYLRVSGLIGSPSGGASISFSLGALSVDGSGAIVLPSGAVLGAGQAVTVLASPASYAVSPAGAPSLQAAQIRVRALQAGGLDNYLSGSVSSLDTQAMTFLLGGQKVIYSGATITPNQMSLGNGQYVQVRGSVGSDGSLTAATVAIADVETEADSQLHGNIVTYDSVANSFTVRGVSVDASTASLQSCPPGGLAVGLYVEVQGTLSSNGVVATTVICQAEPSGGTVERQGVAGSVDPVGRTFVLTRGQDAPLNVQWTDTTYFGRVTPATLSGQTVQVEGTFVGSVLVASKVKIDD